MNFLVRYFFGLPARQVDIDEIRLIIPEILDENTRLSDLRHNRLFLEADCSDIERKIREWASRIKPENKEPKINSSSHLCPSQNCPLRNWQNAQGNDENIYDGLIFKLIVGGGPKPPLEMFLDLVRKVHANKGQVKEVILTDPYLYLEVGADGKTGGFDNLIAYLEALGLASSASFTLKTNPAAKGSTDKKRNFKRSLCKKYSNVKIDEYSPKFKFHDRFCLVKYDDEPLAGVFGPSFNGLSADSIVLMGDIDDQRVFKTLERYFASASASNKSPKAKK